MERCGVACYVWGQQVPIFVDILVNGFSLREHGIKAKKYLCINDNTQQMKIPQLFKAFWNLVPVTHSGLPKHLQGKEAKRLQGVYSKL